MPTASELKELAGAPSGAELKSLAGKERSATRDFGTQFLRGMFDVTAPAVNLFPVGTVESLTGVDIPTTGQEVSERVPGVAQEEPETMAGSAGRLSGAAAGLTPTTGAALSLIPRSAATGGGILTRIGRGLRNLGSDAGATAISRPVATGAVEAGLGASAGAVGFAAKEKFPDSDSAEFIGQILGGILPAFTPTGLVLRAGRGIGRRAMRPFTSSGAERRATQRFRELIPESERAITQLDQPTTLNPQGRPVLTPAQRSEDIGALSLEKAVVDSSNELKRGADEQIANANQAIQQSAFDIADAPPEAAQEYLSNLMAARLRVAAQRADERIERLGSGASREQANRIASEEIEGAMRAGRAQEKELFQAVPQDASVPLSSGTQRFRELLSTLGQAQSNDMPAVARRLLNPESKQFLGEVTNVREIRSLQSKLRETARNARASGAGQNFNRARIADDLADSLTDDLAKTQGAADIQTAVNFSRELNTSFKQGTVGRLLGREATGAQRIPESLSLETTIAGGNAKSREAFDQIIQALDNPNLPGGSEGFRGAAGDFLRQQFLEKAAPGGQLNPQRAQAFLRNNEQLLQRLPDVRQEMEQAVQSGRLADTFRQKITNPKQSKAALFIQKNPFDAFKEITSQTPGRSAKDMQNLINMAKKDDTGVALQGLKSGFIDFLMSGARESQRDITGQRFVSGFKLSDAMENPSFKSAIGRLFNQEERKRLNTVMNDLTRLDQARGVQGALEGIMEDAPGKMIQRIAGIFGAAVGRNVSRAAGSGGTVQIPGQTANMARDMVSAGVKDPATKLIKDAIQDETLFRDVLQRGIKDGKLTERASRRLNAWMAGVLAERGIEQEPTPGESAQQIEAPAL